MSTSRIGLNLLWLRPGQVGGTETYIRRVLRAITQNGHDLDLTLFGTREAIDAVAPEGVEISRIEAPAQFASPVRRVVLERTWMRHRLPDELEVLHHPGGTVPFAGGPPAVLTLHDLQPLVDPGNFARSKRMFLGRAIPAAVHRAAVVAAPSDWVREQVCERFTIDEDRVVTVSAHATQRRSPVEPNPSPQLRALLAKGPVAFYPAMTLRHKNHEMLFEAFVRALERRPDLQLVCVGAIGRDDADIRAAARRSSPRIHMLGHVETNDLDALFAAAEVLVFPSRYEGFGLPILEAHQAGLPVIASNSCAIPEVAGDAATLIDPDDIDTWTDVLGTQMDSAERQRTIDAGVRNVARFTIENTAAQQRCAYDLATS